MLIENLWDGISFFIGPVESLFRWDLGTYIMVDRKLKNNQPYSGKDIERCLAIKQRVPVWGKLATRNTITFRVPRKRAEWAVDIMWKELGVECYSMDLLKDVIGKILGV